ncbi:MAG TPA: hypothetical protein VFJ90_03215, partial [Candidatus Didemnitutus sp.]|nr:hypothetical protein [Candidatus Didemnitutus sp.]
QRLSVRMLLWLAPAVAISAPSVAPELPVVAMSHPYLATVGAPALRFAEHQTLPDSYANPPGGPSAPHSVTEQSKPSPDVSPSAEIKNDPTVPSATKTSPDSNPPVAQPQQPSHKEPTGNPAVPILPDDVHPKARPEDFLPYFQFPGVNHQISNVSTPPVPSSATYRQQ